MRGKEDIRPSEIDEHERAAIEVRKLRRKGIHCHLERLPGSAATHLEVVKDQEPEAGPRVGAISSTASRNEG